MALKDVFKAVDKSSRSYVTGPLDLYLMRVANKDNDRAVNVNAPSQAGKCNRSNYYMRTQVSTDGTIEPRAQRIFDNGSYTHERLQAYLLDMGLLILDEVPLINEEYNIQGHTDGILDLDDEIGVLEIKSINDRGFSQLKDAKEEHKRQGLIYLFCLEERRKYLKETYPTRKEFFGSAEERAEEVRKRYQHLKGGSKYSTEEKIQYQIDLHNIADDILYDTEKPITKVVFLYENKNTQELKEFTVVRNKTTEWILDDTLHRYEELNSFCENNELPPREGTSKSCEVCRWCNFKNECWVL